MTSLILNFLFYTYLVSKEQKFLCFESKNTKSEMTRKYQCYIIQSNALQITFRPVSVIFKHLTQAKAKGYITRGKLPKFYNI